MTHKQKFIQDMHNIFMLESFTYDMSTVVKMMELIMEVNGVSIKEPKDIDVDQFIADVDDMLYSFEEAINSKRNEKLDWFAYTCEAWLDLDALIKKDSAATLNNIR